MIFAAIAVICGINLVVQTHPISSALSLVGVMGALAALYLLLGGEFIAAAQLVVYAGAIMVLFVFVIMLLNAGVEERTKGSRIAILFGAPGAVLFVIAVIWALLRRGPDEMLPIGAMYGSPEGIGHLLFKDFLLPFEVTSVLILIAIMGAVVLARREH
jgi:NADH-quinone oxidoreductase subunit J